MMTSLVSDRTRGSRDKALPATTQSTQPQKQIQATAEQIRLAQVIYDKNDADFEDKVKQLMEVTGKNQDECMVALHDCNEDVNRAINFLLEDSSDTNSWETVGKKRGLVKEGSENKENREKRGEREASRGRGGPTKRGRGATRVRDVRSEENGVDPGPGDRGVDRRGRGRGRGMGVRGRGRGAGGSRFSSQGMGTFNPADYTASAGAEGTRTDTWESGANDGVDGTGAWRNSLDDWATDDWNEDSDAVTVSPQLSETKVFIASSAPAAENHVAPGQSLDLASLLHKPASVEEAGEMEPPSPEGLGHSLVFTNSQHNSRTSATSYAHAALSSVLGSGFGNLGGSKPGQQSAGAQVMEQLKGPGLGPRPTPQPVAGGNSSSTAGVSVTPAASVAPGVSVTSSSVSTSSWDIKPPVTQTTTAASSQFSREFKSQPEPSLVLSQLAQRQQNSLSQPGHLPQVRPASPAARPAPSPPGLEPFPKPHDASLPQDDPSPGAKAMTGDSQGSGSGQQRQMKTQKRRITPTSKIPSSAVEMPGSADVSGLNVQFGALDFGSEAALPDFGQPENNSTREAVPGAQTQSTLYPIPISEPLGSALSLPLPSSLAPPSCATPPASSSSSSSSSGSSLETSAPSHSHLAFPQSQDPPAAPVTNGFNGVRNPTPLDTTSASSTPKPESPSLSSGGSSAQAPSALLPPSVPPHSAALPSLTSELPPASLPALSSHVNSTQSSGSTLSSSSSLTHTIVDSTSSHSTSSVPAFSSATAPLSSNGTASGSSAVSVTSSTHGTGALGLTGNGTTVPSVCRTAPLPSSSSGKAPPNLAQGVPPLLPNQYIMGPGGLLPAYPQIYGYEDLQMLQSRLPMDYYGITFPGPTATLAGRDGSLANTPYSGEVTKFGRADSASPAPPTSLSAAPPPQAPQPPQSQAQSQAAQQQQSGHGAQQAFLNPALPPGYGYTGLPYYPGVPGVPSAFQYGPTMFVPPASAKQHGVGLGNPSTQFQQQPASYGQHTYASGFDDLTQGPAGGDYSKGGYSSSSQAQAKAAAGPGKGISVTSGNAGVPDMTTSVYNKTQSFDKQGFHTGTPPPFSLPSALGGTGPLNPGGAPGYAPAPFLHILPAHQQPHSQLLHHHLTQDGQGGPSQRSQSSGMQQKTQATKSSYGSSPYWGN
ncbi:ubiquitin-associated protein 2-like isoform X1 [Megalops cyprinoides]|uniref:ubiquitin-associated protein 2-like isoform X1 n=1 Tax=Megalops cyprinoides TaxID=118141 RepID=UPI00186511EC|nr:ubiquitin-associated protein 2-like isoform X1 [Megalops cyprinoides]XP_036382883.1 ubiquitin-associated protein 2-like isoform X1 [Megalops cyprinoides]